MGDDGGPDVDDAAALAYLVLRVLGLGVLLGLDFLETLAAVRAQDWPARGLLFVTDLLLGWLSFGMYNEYKELERSE